MNPEDIASGTDMFEMLAEADFSTIDTSYPVLVGGTYELEVAEMERAQSKDKEGTYLKIKCKLVSDTGMSTKDEPIAPGFVITHIISLVKTDKYDPLKSVTQFLEGLGMEDQPFDPSFEAYIGQSFVARTRVEPEREDQNTGQVYPPATKIASFIKPEAA